MSGGTWVKRADPDSHRCPAPVGSFGGALGNRGDLWRCDDCGTLWRVGDACDWCDAYGHIPHDGHREVGLRWRPATFWQRLRHRQRWPSRPARSAEQAGRGVTIDSNVRLTPSKRLPNQPAMPPKLPPP